MFRKPAYLVHYGEGDDFIEFDLEVHITKSVSSYSMNIVRATISQTTMPFAAKMFEKLSDSHRDLYNALFREIITKDMEPLLHSYYHEGEILNGNQSQTV